MPDHDEKLCGDSPKEINLDASPEEFAHLLDVIDHRLMAKSYSWPELGSVMDLGVKYHFFHLCQLVIGQIDDYQPMGDPWPVFALASQLDLPNLAKLALADFGQSHIGYTDEHGVKARDMEGATGVYAAALLRAIGLNVDADLRQVSDLMGNEGWIRETDWAGVSRDFDLDK